MVKLETKEEFGLFHKKFQENYNKDLSEIIEKKFEITLPISWTLDTISLEVFCQRNGLKKKSEKLYKKYVNKIKKELKN